MSDPIGPEFMRQTELKALGPSQAEQGQPMPPLELPFPQDAQRIPLPKPSDIQAPEMSLREAVEQRRTIRNYTGQPLTLEELAYLLWISQGVKRISSRPSTARTVPSAGARHAFETYVLANRVEGLQPGLYRYLAIEQSLLPANLSDEINEQITQACDNQNQVRTSAATFIWVAVMERMVYRYGQRGYRYLHLDAGHVCQNLYLAAENIGAGACAIAHFKDDELNQALAVDGEQQFVIYLASVGKKQPRA